MGKIVRTKNTQHQFYYFSLFRRVTIAFRVISPVFALLCITYVHYRLQNQVLPTCAAPRSRTIGCCGHLLRSLLCLSLHRAAHTQVHFALP
ncbi:hypothetical protein GDO81_024372 [Engystomops pustulosus]|uniref:Uncharacterized protein n=1 Tax=Engystomops pustulosus TaxID=76066 RepID=A0AAV6Z829_ENGPU|nr:hypothetical protein GDO81_024372 [Engystomops pustulosus]